MELTTPLTAPLMPALSPPPAARMRVLDYLGVLMRALWSDHGIFRYWFNTRAQVAAGVYRSSHPLPSQLRAARRAGIRTIISLRQPCPQIASNLLSWAACERYGLRQLHFAFNSRRAPRREEVLGFEALLDQVEYPILLHCKSGADRAGLASALYLLLRTSLPLDQALQQLSWRFGHIRQADAGILDHFFEAYREHHRRHATPFREWVREHYDPKALTCSFRPRGWARRLANRLLRRE